MSEEKVTIIFDSQILNSVQACALKTKYMFHEDLTLPDKATPLEEGDLLHRMFEVYNLGLIGNNELRYDDEKWKELVEKAVSHGEFSSIEMNLIPAEVSEVIFQFKEYVKHNRMDGIEILEVERPFMIELYNEEDLRVIYTGKIDRYTNTPHYGLCPRDYKKAQQNKTPLPLSNQFTGYAVATNTNLIFVDKVGFQKTLTPEKRFVSYPIYYPPEVKETWIQNTIWWARQYAFYITTQTWPMNLTSCDKYSGCIFTDICSAGTKEAKEMVIKTKYIIGEKWDPCKVLSKGKEDASQKSHT